MRLIDADSLIYALEKLDVRYDSGHYCRNIDTQLLLRKSVLETVGEMQCVPNAFAFPCNVGDRIYYIPNKDEVRHNVERGAEWLNRVYARVITEIIIGNGRYNVNKWYIKCGVDRAVFEKIYFADVDFGKSWFLSESEAKLALIRIEEELKKEEVR